MPSFSGLIDDRVLSPGAAGDVDGDVEVVINTYGQGDPINGNLFLFHHDGALDANWPQWAGVAQTPSAYGGPALGDLDGDGRLEIVTGSIRGAYVFRADGTRFESFPRLTDEVFTQPMLADLDHDGRVEIVEVALNDGIYVWRASDPATPSYPWPNFRQNPAHTGTLESPVSSSIPAASTIGLVAMFTLLLCAGAVVLRRAAVPCSRTEGG